MDRSIFTSDDHTAAVKAIAWCPFKSNLLASGGGTADRTIRMWNTIDFTCIKQKETFSQVSCIKWSTNYEELISSHGFSKHNLAIWDYNDMKIKAELLGHTSRVISMAISPNGEKIVSVSGDETLRFWNVFEKEVQKKNKKIPEKSLLEKDFFSLLR